MARNRFDGCLGFGWLGLCMAAFITVPLYCQHRAGRGDDPYFHTAPCAHGHRSARVEVTPAGFAPEGCVRTDRQSFRFVNRLAVPVTICLGRGGTCATGHDPPFGRVTLRPGESRELRFPFHRSWWWYEGVAREYPVTAPGLPSGATDLVVRSEVPVSD
jgi:hypothetical protein